MSNWIGKVETQNEESDILVTHDLQDCIDESLDFNFNNVFAPSNNRPPDNIKSEKLNGYLQTIEHNEENVG